MILAVDVHYKGSTGYCAAVIFNNWGAPEAVREMFYKHSDVLDYAPGQFYKRELPCILGLLAQFAISPTIIVVDGYVFLDSKNKPGLGKHLFDALNGSSAVVGVAKSAFTGIDDGLSVFRGQSRKPLFVTSIGIALTDARRSVLEMHGAYRIPTLLKRVDMLARLPTR